MIMIQFPEGMLGSYLLCHVLKAFGNSAISVQCVLEDKGSQNMKLITHLCSAD
jgi:hypothetical protein